MPESDRRLARAGSASPGRGHRGRATRSAPTSPSRSPPAETAKARERAMQNMVRLAVQEAYVRAKSAQERAALLRTTILPQAQQTLDVSRIGYQTDKVDFQAVIDNQRTLLDAQLGYVRALSEFEQATADLERAVGADLPEGTTASVTRARRGSAMKRALLIVFVVAVVAARRWRGRLRRSDAREGERTVSADRSRGDAEHARRQPRGDRRTPDDASGRRDDRSTPATIDRREDRRGGSTNGRSERPRDRCRAVRRDEAGRREREDRGLDSRSVCGLHRPADRARPTALYVVQPRSPQHAERIPAGAEDARPAAAIDDRRRSRARRCARRLRPSTARSPGICPPTTSSSWTRRGAPSTRSCFARRSADSSSRRWP